jgi:hypothetical protein
MLDEGSSGTGQVTAALELRIQLVQDRAAYNLLTWEPVSGFEPLTCRLQEVRPYALSVLTAAMAQVIPLTAPAALV